VALVSAAGILPNGPSMPRFVGHPFGWTAHGSAVVGTDSRHPFGHLDPSVNRDLDARGEQWLDAVLQAERAAAPPPRLSKAAVLALAEAGPGAIIADVLAHITVPVIDPATLSADAALVDVSPALPRLQPTVSVLASVVASGGPP
jgi:hypothetical protein